MPRDVRVVATADDLARAAASEIVAIAAEAVRTSGRFTIVLSGGTTPGRLYSHVASDAGLTSQMPWAQTHVFWGDERHVPPEHADSNYRLAYENMLSKVPVPAGNVHRVEIGVADPRHTAAAYERELTAFFDLAPGQLPRFDVVLLGMGADGHTASLFPGTEALADRTHLFVANWVPQLATTRLTMTLPVLNNAACVIFLISGADKAKTLAVVLGSEERPAPYPAGLVQPANGKLIWFVTQDAAELR